MPLLEVKGITKRFGGLSAVKDLDLTIEQGEIVGMIGPNGAGKTTAFNMISGFYKPDEGKIFLNKENITSLRPDEICKRGLARTFQIVKPFPELLVVDNVAIGILNHESSVNKARKEAVEILKFLDLDYWADRPAYSLPIAGRKRLEIARALATQPQLLLFDEVMAGLRPKETEDIIKIVRKIQEKGITILMVEHVMRVIMALANRIVVLNYGQKIADDIPEVVVNNQEVIVAYLGEIQTHVSSN